MTIVPLSVIHGDKLYRDGVDLTPSTFYPMLGVGDVLPTTSQPSPAQFKEVYKQVLRSVDEIISVHLSGKLRATCTSARLTAEEVAGDRLHVVDSGFESYALGLQVQESATLAMQEATTPEILQRLEHMRVKMELAFTLDTLHYLQKGGRIGRVSALLGTVLGIKPVIRIEEGHLIPAGKVRDTKGALQFWHLGSREAILPLTAKDAQARGFQWMIGSRCSAICGRLHRMVRKASIPRCQAPRSRKSPGAPPARWVDTAPTLED